MGDRGVGVRRHLAAVFMAMVLGLAGALGAAVGTAPPATAATTLVVTITTSVWDPNDGQLSLGEALYASESIADDVIIELGTNLSYDFDCKQWGLFATHKGRLTVNGHGSTVTCPTPNSSAFLGYGGPGLEVHDLTVTGFGSALVVDGSTGSSAPTPVLLDHVTFTGNGTKAAEPRRAVGLYGRVALTVTSSSIVGNAGWAIATINQTGPASGRVIAVTDSTVDGNGGGIGGPGGSGAFPCECEVWVESSSISNNGAMNVTVTAAQPNPMGIGARRVTLVDANIDGNTHIGVSAQTLRATDSTVDRTGNPQGWSLAYGVITADGEMTGGSIQGLWPGVTGLAIGIIVDGGVGAAGGRLRLDGVAVTDNSTGVVVNASDGSGPFDVEVKDGAIDRNGVGFYTRKVVSADSVLTLRRMSIQGNRRGVQTAGPGQLVIEDSTVAGNNGPYGGGVWSYAGPVTVRGSTIVDNVDAATEPADAETVGNGGGIVMDRSVDDTVGPGSLVVERSTVAGNRGGTGATSRDVSSPGGAVTFDRSIVGTPDPTPGALPACILTGTVTAVGRSAGDGTCGIGSGPADVVGDPLLGPLGDHGGPNPTRVPAFGSPALDRAPIGTAGCGGAGWNVDQRGVSRPQGIGCDAGAVEAVYGGFHPLAPARIFDTRDGQGTKLGPGESRLVVTAARGGVPTHRVAAVVANVTVTNPTEASHLSVFPGPAPLPSDPPPTVSSLNWPAGATIANLVTVGVGAGGFVVRNNSGSAHVIVDVAGWYDDGGADGPGLGDPGSSPTGGAGYVGLTTPVRVFDTRSGLGTTKAKIAAAGTRAVTVAGANGIPANAKAVVVNLTGVLPSTGTHLTVWPTGGGQPIASNLNLPAGAVAANQAVVPVGPDGRITVRNNTGTVDVIVDVVGWYGEGVGARFRPVPPQRVFDSRSPGPGSPIGAGQVRAVDLRTLVGLPGGVTVVGNLTGTQPTAVTHITAAPLVNPFPTDVSSLNLSAGETRPNAIYARTSVTTGSIGLRNNSGTVHLIVDLAGWFA